MGGSTPTNDSKMVATEKRLEIDDATNDAKRANADTNTPQQEQEISPMAAYFKLWSFATPLDVFFRCLGALACAGAGAAEPLMAIVFGNLVNVFNGDPPVSPEEFRSQINKNALYFVYLFIGKFALIYIGATLFNFTSARMTSKIRLRYLSKVLHQPISFFDKNAPGSISTSLANDTNVVQVGLAEKIGIVFQVISMILVAFIIAFTKGWKLTLVTATVVPYVLITTGFFGGMAAEVEAKGNKTLNQGSGVAEEALSSILNVTSLGASEKVVRRYNAYLEGAMGAFKRVGPLQACTYGNMFLAVHSAYALALFYGVKLFSKGEIQDGGTVVTVLFCMILASSAISFIGPLIPDFTKAVGAAQQIVKMIGDPKVLESSKDDSSKLKLDSLRGDIKLKDVSFSYPERPEVRVLDNVDIDFPANKVTALVGHSGSGKSTIVGLLERWYSTNQGIILVDGHDVTELDTTWLRMQIGLVQQEPMLFNDTIYQNVLNGLRGDVLQNLSESKKRQLVIEACKTANANEFIEKLPNGYDTVAGERAGLLSGGQKQRVAIARSIISNPKILLLDEATSALDSESERAVTAALEKASEGRTTVMIAHKLSTIAHADNIVVLNKGAVVEQGTHAELLALDGHYCRLLQAQGNREHSSNNDFPLEESGVTRTVSRTLTRQSTHVESDPLKAITSPLESEEISRRHSIFVCIYKMYSENPSLLWPTSVAFVAALVCGAAYPLQAVFFSRLTTIFQATGSELITRGNFWALMFFVLGISQLFGFLVLMYFMGIVGAEFGTVYRRSYLKAMLWQDIGFFQAAGNTSGGLTALLSADGVDLSMLFASSSGLIVVFVVDLIACCILALAMYWKLALVAIFGCIPALLAAGFMRMRIDLTAQDRCAAAFLESARYSTEAVTAIRTVSSLTMEDKIEVMYSQKLQDASNSSIKKTMQGLVLYALSDALTLAACALTFWYGGRLVSFGELSTTQFFIIFAAVIFGGQSAGIMFGFTNSITKAHAAMNRILWITHSKPPINSSTGADPKAASFTDTPTIEFRDVYFRYPSRPTVPVLRGVSLSITRGSHICIVGPSGCGKSTVVALLERFYDLQPQSSGDEKYQDSGEICVYGRPIAEWDISKLRKMMGLVAQDTTLYQGTIRDNILMGIEESEVRDEEDIDARIQIACTQANIHAFITSLPQGYATDIGARGVALSGGQRQRLALARCLIRNPEILLLDEATSALDPESEKAVRDALRKARIEREGLTVISVTHQIEGMRDADRIFVVDKGVIVEEGRWDNLMGRKGRLWAMIVQGEVEGGA